MDWASVAIGFGGGVVFMVASAVVWALTESAEQVTPRVGALEVAEQLQRIAEGEVGLVGVYPDEQGETVEVETADSWCIVFAYEEGMLVGVDLAVSPDDRLTESGGWRDGPDGRNPLEILAERDPALVGLLALKVQPELAGV